MALLPAAMIERLFVRSQRCCGFHLWDTGGPSREADRRIPKLGYAWNRVWLAKSHPTFSWKLSCQKLSENLEPGSESLKANRQEHQRDKTAAALFQWLIWLCLLAWDIISWPQFACLWWLSRKQWSLKRQDFNLSLFVLFRTLPVTSLFPVWRARGLGVTHKSIFFFFSLLSFYRSFLSIFKNKSQLCNFSGFFLFVFAWWCCINYP